MATTEKALFRGAATTTLSTVLYTVPGATRTIVTEIVAVNTSGSIQNFTIALDGVVIAATVTVGAYDSTVINIHQPLAATKTITGGASATLVNLHIAGVEIA